MIRVLFVVLLLAWAACVEAAPCDIQPLKIFAGALTTTPDTVVYTVPAGKKAVVTSVIVGSKATGTTVRAVTVESSTACWLCAFGLAANQTEALMIGPVLNAGDTITAWQGVGTDVRLTISGALYTCPP